MSQTLQNFREITKYPRPSKKEEKIRNFLVEWAKGREYRHQVDATGNLIVYVDAKNSTSLETIILQSHMDMVCVKTPESTHDFLVDPIDIYEADGYLRARNTSLGADNGIGVALSMAACDFESHPALELVFTMDEEDGMTGVEGLDFSLLSGKKVINLDSEDENEICISSAGGIGILPTKKHSYKANTDEEKYTLAFSGMQGGHSGCEIHENRGNAIIVLLEAIKKFDEIEAVYTVQGGYACNVIPSKAEAVLKIHNYDNFTQKLEQYIQEVKNTFDCPNLVYFLEKNNTPLGAIQDGKALLSDIASIRTGVYAMSKKIPGLVQTSMNLGIIDTQGGNLSLTYLARSSVNTELHGLFESTANFFEERGYGVANDRGYLGWQDDPDSLLVRITSEEIAKVIGKKPKVMAIHAGLECGAMVSGLGEGVNAISIGPNVYDVHSVNEKVEIASIERFEKILEGILGRL